MILSGSIVRFWSPNQVFFRPEGFLSHTSRRRRETLESRPRLCLSSMGKLKNYDCHKQKYYVPQDKPKWAVLNLKQASKKIDKEKSSAKKQVLGKKARVAQKLANRKGGRGVRNPANPEFKKNLEKVRVTRETRAGRDALEPDTSPETPAALSCLTRRRRRHCSFDLRAAEARTPPDAASRPTHALTVFPALSRAGQDLQEAQARGQAGGQTQLGGIGSRVS